jgi:hypothetical protein
MYNPIKNVKMIANYDYLGSHLVSEYLKKKTKTLDSVPN